MGKKHTREVVAIVEEVDERCNEIINKLNAGKITLYEAVTEARRLLDIEYTEPMHDFVWEYGGYLDRIIEKEEKKRFFESLSEEEKKRYLERGGCLYPCEVCDPDSKNAPCYDP